MTTFEKLKNTNTWAEFKYGDILQESDLNYLIHQANCYCCMGAGIAKQLADKYPIVTEVDNTTVRGDYHKLGTYTIANISDNFKIVNLYSQYLPGRACTANEINNSLHAIKTGLTSLKLEIKTTTKSTVIIGFPWLIGCGIYGLDETTVFNIIKSVFEFEPLFTIKFIKFK